MPEGHRRQALLHALAALAIGGVAWAAYGSVLHAPFVFDDIPNIQDNTAIHWREIGLPGLWRAATESPNPRPVAYLSFGLNHRLGGLEPWGYRAANVVLHAVNAWMVYALALALFRRAARRGWPAGAAPGAAAVAAGLLFVAHPLQIQSVTYVVQRMNALAAGFCLAALLLYLAARAAPSGGRRRALGAAALGAWLLALGSKPNAAVLPFAVWLIEWLVERDMDGAWLRRSLPWLLAGVAALLGAAFLASHGFRAYALQDFGMGERLLTQPRVFWLYAGLVLWPLPSRLNLVHDVLPSSSWLDPPTTGLALLGLVGLAAAWRWLAPRRRLPALGLAWFALFLAPESSLLPLAMLNEHRLYLPLAGVALAVPAVLFAALPRGAATAASLAAALALGAATWTRNQAWSDPVTLWSDAVAKSPGSWRAHDELGLALAHAGRESEAGVHFGRAVELHPGRAEPRVHLGFLRARAGALDEGLELLREAVRVQPDSARGHHTLGLVLLDRGLVEEALPPLRRAARLRPLDARMRAVLGLALLRAGRRGAALDELDEALRLDPAAAAVQNNLAWLLATAPEAPLRDPDRAVALALEASRDGTGRDVDLLDTLAAAYAAAGRFDEAERVADRALELAAPEDAGALRARRELYRRRQPYRDTRAGR